MSIGDQIEGFFLLQDAYSKTTLAGKPFLSMVLSDCTGTIDAQIWDYTGPITPKDIGAVVKIRGAVSEFKGTLQIILVYLHLKRMLWEIIYLRNRNIQYIWSLFSSRPLLSMKSSSYAFFRPRSIVLTLLIIQHLLRQLFVSAGNLSIPVMGKNTLTLNTGFSGPH